jgi:hypothetical protein
MGVATLAESLVRGVLLNMGFQALVRWDSSLSLPKEREIDIAPGERVDLAFTDDSGAPLKIPGTLNGEYLTHTQRFAIEPMKRPVTVLAHRQSELMVRKGLARPGWPLVT